MFFYLILLPSLTQPWGQIKELLFHKANPKINQDLQKAPSSWGPAQPST